MVSFLETVHINYMVYLFFQRGLLSPNKTWWYITENILEDSSGLNLFNRLKKDYGDFVPINITGNKLYIVTDVNVVRFMLDNSPNLFSVGKFKYRSIRLSFYRTDNRTTALPIRKRCFPSLRARPSTASERRPSGSVRATTNC